MNTIHLYAGWLPDYYVTVDDRVRREFGKDIAEKFNNIPKFIPYDLREWRGENFVTFNHIADDLKRGWKPNELPGITYHNVMHVAMQIAFWMGFTTLLLIGVEHKQDEGNKHFWGVDEGMPAQPPVPDWYTGYETLVKGMAEHGVKVLNISEESYCPAEILPREDWRKYAKN